MSLTFTSTPALTKRRDIRVAIDRGGTFTDVYATQEIPVLADAKAHGDKDTLSSPQALKEYHFKLLSEDSLHYKDANIEGIRRVLEYFTGESYPRNQPLPSDRLISIRLGTTVATNALLERKGEPCVLVITKGFKDLLHIGTQARPNIFDLKVIAPSVLYAKVIELDERVALFGYTMDPDRRSVPASPEPGTDVLGASGEWVRVLKSPEDPTAALRAAHAEGFRSVAVCLMHSYAFPAHERQIAECARAVGFEAVSCSAALLPRRRIVPRSNTALLDAYLTPKLRTYLDGFLAGFSEAPADVLLMQSDGGLAPVDAFRGHQAILSGPAAGVVGYAKTMFKANGCVPLIGFDMGGTSTDVSRFDGEFAHVLESMTEGIPISTPQLDIQTVAAGGSSRLFYRNGLFAVGPESAGSEPGPLCYRKSKAMLALTDANVVLGRISLEHFPKVFGPDENEPLDCDASLRGFHALQSELPGMSVDEIAYGFVQVANTTMAQKILALTHARGFDVAQHHLACFGGAAAQHAVDLARQLGIARVLVHRRAAVLSAYGLALAPRSLEVQVPLHVPLDKTHMPQVTTLLAGRLATLREEYPETQCFVLVRYEGTDTDLQVPVDPANMCPDAALAAFAAMYARMFGFVLERRVYIEGLRIRALTAVAAPPAETALPAMRDDAPISSGTQSMYVEGGRRDVPVYWVPDLLPGHLVRGPALVLDTFNTLVLTPDTCATVTRDLLVVDVPTQGAARATSDPVQLSLFGYRFMHIAEEMGRVLQKTAISTNIKERLDFSCALFTPEGHLVANAPHIPVHLGSMQAAIQCQLERHAFQDGDVVLTNHPALGGSHLPDLTVITPVFQGNQLLCFVASRGHHADIGGITPGSMPAFSTSLADEGAVFESELLVRNHVFQDQRIRDLFLQPPGARNVDENISDLKAQVAANQRGVLLCKEMFQQYSVPCVHGFMDRIRENAAAAVRTLLRKTRARLGPRLHALDHMDDGTPIQLTVDIAEDGTAHFDFRGTGYEVLANHNAPFAITLSAILYCLRAMLECEIPLNQGCLEPITLHIPKGSILSPSPGAAVVAGNVLTSQRVVDVVLRAFQACAASQGDCNNLTFGVPAQPGKSGWGYYETIAGGAGAGPTWDGRSGVHTHMTNTRITDPEVLERRYPVLLNTFTLRPGSGGKGQFRGGDGVIRSLTFLERVQVSILSERRAIAPYGMQGGDEGKCGLNVWTTRDGRKMNVGSKASFWAGPGDTLTIETPGAGGYGAW